MICGMIFLPCGLHSEYTYWVATNTVEYSIILCYSHPPCWQQTHPSLHTFLTHTELQFDKPLNNSHGLVDWFPGLIKGTLHLIVYWCDHLFTQTQHPPQAFNALFHKQDAPIPSQVPQGAYRYVSYRPQPLTLQLQNDLNPKPQGSNECFHTNQTRMHVECSAIIVWW